MPVYFLSIGGPNFMENTEHPAYAKLGEVGKEITTKVKPKAIVVFSAHWQDSPNRIQINAAEDTDIIYDFYGFPPHYYEYKFPNKGSPELANKVIEKLGGVGIEVQKVKRGLDHGVWAGFVVGMIALILHVFGMLGDWYVAIAFDPQKNPLNIPIVQVSLFNNEDVERHYRMGEALQSLRDDGILIVGAGMAVHNLQDFRASRGSGKNMTWVLPPNFSFFAIISNGLGLILCSYSSTFDDALKDAVESNPEERERKMLELLKRSDGRQAHPTLDHLLPMYVAAGAAGESSGQQLWTMPELSLSWAQYRFGELKTTAWLHGTGSDYGQVPGYKGG
jgi:4,5-DOPA dioxygenase extradiol